MFRKHLFLLGLMAALPTIASACLSRSVVSEDHVQLFEAPKASPTEMFGLPIQNQIREFWIVAPDELSQLMLDGGRRRIRHIVYQRAGNVLSEPVEYCPTYAEGWNQSAFDRYCAKPMAGRSTTSLRH